MVAKQSLKDRWMAINRTQCVSQGAHQKLASFNFDNDISIPHHNAASLTLKGVQSRLDKSVATHRTEDLVSSSHMYACANL